MSDMNFFDVWKDQLRLDCEREQKLSAFNSLLDCVLRIFSQQGIHPSVRAIIEAGDSTD